MSGGGGGSKQDPLQETPAEQEMARIAVERYNDYQTRFAPLENRLMAEVRTTPGEYAQGLGQANAASEQQFANARNQYRDQQFARGVNPASGAFTAGLGGLKRSEALSSGNNMASMGQSLSDQEVYGLAGVTQLGQGQSTNAFQQYGQQASSAQQQAMSDAQIALNESLANQQLTGSVLGMGAAGLMHYGPGLVGGGSAPTTMGLNPQGGLI